MNARVLVMGITFKEDVSDIRNSKVMDIINELLDYGVSVDVVDPRAVASEVLHEYDISLIDKPMLHEYDTVVVAVSHREYLALDEAYFRSLTTPQSVLADIKGLYRGKIKEMVYWSL